MPAANKYPVKISKSDVATLRPMVSASHIKPEKKKITGKKPASLLTRWYILVCICLLERIFEITDYGLKALIGLARFNEA
jgi:hypothetical protein